MRYYESFDNYKINNSLLKMAFLSILYIFIGLILFGRKKFEVVETSFKSDNVHLFVRSLTTVPILCIYYIFTNNIKFFIFCFSFKFPFSSYLYSNFAINFPSQLY